MNKNNIFAFAIAFVTLASITPFAFAQPHSITVNFWTDQNMVNKYQNAFMKVYFQNQTYVGGYDYQYHCYHADYVNGTAVILVNETNSFDLLITDGNLQWSNITGCPTTVENYQFWSTVQTNMLIDGDQTLNYFINVTITGQQPRTYFWKTQNMRTLFSALYWLIVLVGIIVLEWYLTKHGGNPSWILPIIILIVAVIVKLALGI